MFHRRYQAMELSNTVHDPAHADAVDLASCFTMMTTTQTHERKTDDRSYTNLAILQPSKSSQNQVQVRDGLGPSAYRSQTVHKLFSA